MAREEHEREDLLRDAVALAERFEIELADRRRVVVGFRRDGCASIYFDGDPAWHFNQAGQLRRAFVDGYLFKAERGTLVRLRRQRTTDAVELLRHECTADETSAFLARLADDLNLLGRTFEAGDYRLVGQVPANAPHDAPLVERARDWLAKLPRPIGLARTPRAE